MDKYFKKKIILVIFALVCLVAVLFGCIKDEQTDDGDKTMPPDTQEEQFFDISKLNYNELYENEQNPEEKGYLVYDYIDFNKISFTRRFSRPPKFAIFLNEEQVGSVEMSSGGTVYSTFPLPKAGKYKIIVTGNSDGKNVRSTFYINVSSGGLPNKVEFELLDKLGNKVTKGKAGEEFYLNAKVYTDDTYLEMDTEKFYTGWAGGNEGERRMLITFPNLIKDTVITHTFYYYIKKGVSTHNVRKDFPIEVTNNYQGITYEYGTILTNNEATISVDDINGENNFMTKVKAWHNFTNGDKSEINVYYNTDYPPNDCITAFFRYDDGEYNRYARFDYETAFGNRFSNYVANGASYQFDPAQNRVQVYLNYCYFEDHQGYTIRKYQELENSTVFFNLSFTPPTDICVDKITGMQDNGHGDYIIFSNRTVTENEVSVKVRNPNLTQDKQYFNLNVILEGTTSIPDYYFEIEGEDGQSAVIGYNKNKKYFYAFQTGVSYIIVKSCFSDVSYRLKIIVVEHI